MNEKHIISNYSKVIKDDANRDEQANLLKTLRERGNGSGVPVFTLPIDKAGLQHLVIPACFVWLMI
jgi:hypothetical protein